MTSAPACDPRPPLRRPVADRWVGGVASGLARHLGLPVVGVRWALVGVSLVVGIGALAYLLLWALVPSDAPAVAGPHSGSGRGRTTGRPGRTPAEGPVRPSLDSLRHSKVLRDQGPGALVGAGLLAVGSAQLARRAGVDIDPVTVAALAVTAAGVLIALSQLDAAERDRWLASAGGDTGPGMLRLAAGVVLAVVGLALLVSGRVDATAVRSAVLAAGAVLLGVGLLVAPWVQRLGRDLVAERSARIRETERAEIAAHLHDSVLQTLALIQRRAGDPVEVGRLARAQERQLREWLYTGPAQDDEQATGGLASAVRAAVAEVEDVHAVAVDVVTVGDAPLDGDTRALVLALREAVLNAVRHGAPPVAVYVEASAERVEAFVRDHGEGVDVEQIPPDRLGVRESVLGRMERHGGRAELRRAPGGGTEVALLLGGAAAPGDDEAGRAGRPAVALDEERAGLADAAPNEQLDEQEERR